MMTMYGYILIALGLGHIVVGIVKYRPALANLFRDGYINAASGHPDRLLVFWFLLFAALLLLLGQLTLYAASANDVYLLKLVGWYLAVIGIAGTAALPRSPFWVALVVGPLILLTVYTS